MILKKFRSTAGNGKLRITTVERLRFIARKVAKETKDINPITSLSPLLTDQLLPIVVLV